MLLLLWFLFVGLFDSSSASTKVMIDSKVFDYFVLDGGKNIFGGESIEEWIERKSDVGCIKYPSVEVVDNL